MDWVQSQEHHEREKRRWCYVTVHLGGHIHFVSALWNPSMVFAEENYFVANLEKRQNEARRWSLSIGTEDLKRFNNTAKH